MIDFFAENALEHERTGEMISRRIGLDQLPRGHRSVEIDPNMADHAAHQPYVRTTTAGTTKSRRINASKASRPEGSTNMMRTTTDRERRSGQQTVLHPTLLKNYGNWK